RFLRLVQQIVSFTQIQNRDRFAPKIPGGTLALDRLAVIFDGLFVLSLGGIRDADLVERLSFVRAIIGLLLNRPRLGEKAKSLLVLGHALVNTADVQERVRFGVFISAGAHQRERLLKIIEGALRL